MSTKLEKYGPKVQEHLYFSKKLNSIGITNTFIGFYYLVDIMDILINKEEHVKSFSRQVYPVVAEDFNKKQCTVERDIRVIINSLWQRKLKDTLSDFWAKERNPHCCEFIYIIKNFLIKDLI